MPQEKQRDEIDLIDLFFKAVVLLQKNFWLILAFFVAGSLLGLAYFYSSSKVYESQLVVSSDILTESYAKVLFDISNTHLRQGNIDGLAGQLHVDISVASQVKLITIEKLSTVEIKENERFLITVGVLDPQILPALQEGIVKSMSENEFVAVRQELKKNGLRETITATEREIKDLQDFKVNLYKGDFFERNRGNVMFDPTEVNSKILELEEKRIQLENDLKLANSVQVIQRFTKYQRQVSPRLSVSLIAGSTVGLAFVVLFIAFKSIRRILSIAATKEE
jgi:hypothetical protein